MTIEVLNTNGNITSIIKGEEVLSRDAFIRKVISSPVPSEYYNNHYTKGIRSNRQINEIAFDFIKGNGIVKRMVRKVVSLI